MTRIIKDVPAFFWSQVEIKGMDECWPWKGFVNLSGYGSFRIYERYIIASRFSFMLWKNEDITQLCVCHSCDNPLCVNPNHLWAGTHMDNTKDKVRKGRHLKGEGIKNSKLKQWQVEEIRNLYETKQYNQYELAAKYDCSQSSISFIVRNLKWQ